MQKRLRGKVHPKLRMFANADPMVNEVRAELASTLCVPDIAADSPVFREAGAVPIAPGDKSRAAPCAPKKWKRDRRTFVNVFVDLSYRAAPPVPGEKYRKGNIALAQVPVADVEKIAKAPGVAMVSGAEALKFAAPAATAASTPPQPRKLRLPKDGERIPVLLGIVDVQGFDFAHEDFLKTDRNGTRTTRFERIWDQGGRSRKPPQYADDTGRLRYDYGSEIRTEHLYNALTGQAKTKIPATDLEPQSEMVPGSHGTHVASIAGGNAGVCPDAILAGVLISLPDADLERRKSFYNSSRLIDAIEYLFQVAADLGEEMNKGIPLPVSINISLGTNGDAHDGSSPLCRWIENALATAGRCITVASGNAGQALPMAPGDIGYVMGRVHTAGMIASRGLASILEWTVVGNGKADISENELEIWYSAQDRFNVSLLPPDSNKWIGPVGAREYIQNKQLADGTFVSIYNEIYHPVNGCNQIAIYLSPNLTPGDVVGIDSGVWTVRLVGDEVRDGRFHGWIERDDPAPLGKLGPQEAWRFPSFFTERTNVPVSQISSLACSPRIVSVANFEADKDRIHPTSSQGPTRDGRNKPDIAAPGTDIVAAGGFSGNGAAEWIKMTGTSMASPYVAGVAAAMLSVAPRLNAAQINGIIQSTAKPLPGKTYTWANDSGFGTIDAPACLKEAGSVNHRNNLTKEASK